MSAAIGFENSWLFVLKCLKEYWADCPFLLYFFAGLIWTYGWKKGKEDRIFWYAVWVLGLTVYNPLLIHLIVPRFLDAEIYYRFFWLLPVTIGVAYYAALMVAECGKTWKKCAAAAVFMALIVTTSSVNGNIVYNVRLPENLYKVPDAVLYACDLIHRDYEGEGEPKAVFTDEYEIYVRQYDPSIRLTIDRNTRLYYNGSSVVGEVKETKAYKRRKRILDVLNSAEEVPVKKFRKALQKTKTNYLVVPEWYSCHAYLLEAGLTVVDQTGGIIVYRFDLEENENIQR